MFFIGLQNLNKHLIHSRQHLLTHLCWHFLILSNLLMRPKNKNSQTIDKVKKSTRMGQRPKWLENYTCWRTGEETVCGMWVLLSSVIEFFILSSVILISSSIIAYCDSHFQVISEIQKKDQILIVIILFVIP